MKKKSICLALCAAMISMLAAGCEPAASGSTQPEESSASTAESTGGESSAPEDMVELSMLACWNDPMDGIDEVLAQAEQKLGIKVTYEKFSGGEEGDNIVKTRLAAGDMSDICLYNSGSLLMALNPPEYFVDLADQPFAENLDDTYVKSVSVDGGIYGIPSSSSYICGVLYNKAMYEKYNLEIPGTWDEFLANCQVLKDAGETAMVGSYGTSWTAQLPYLGDHYNVELKNPNFAKEFEAGTLKYANDAAGLESFQKIADVTQFLNSDYLATTYDDACEIMAEGQAGHWIIFTAALGNIYALYGDQVNDLGVFAIPGDDPQTMGATVWEPSSYYANKNSDKVDDIMRFFEFYVSDEGLDAYTSKILPNGPYCVKGYELPDNCYDAVKDLQSMYFDEGKVALALEFQTAVKGPNCASICQELGSGQTTAAEAAGKYDQDCEKQAKQLGLDW